MKNLLIYQTTEYDCGPVSLTNGIRFLFDREAIYPDMVKYIMLYCLDTYNEAGECGKRGTSATAMLFLSNWLNQFCKTKNFPFNSEFLSGADVVITPDSKIITALRQGGAVILRLNLEVGHYVLLTGLSGDSAYIFDSYYEEEDDPDLSPEYHQEGITFISGQPKFANRLVSLERLNRIGMDYYEMGPLCTREAVIMFNTKTGQK